MRKSLWIVLAAMVVAVSAPNAHADSFTYEYTLTTALGGFSWTTVALPAATMPTNVPFLDIAAQSFFGINAGCITIELGLNLTGEILTVFDGGSSCPGFNAEATDLFNPSDFGAAGTYKGLVGGTLVVTPAVTAPEPGSVALMLMGVGLAFLLRKRKSRGHQLAA